MGPEQAPRDGEPDLPQWAQYAMVALVLATLFFFALRPEPLRVTEEMEPHAARMRQGPTETRSPAIWELKDAPPAAVAGHVPVLIGIIGDDTPASEAISSAYSTRQRELAGPLFAFKEETVRIGDLAAFAIRRIRAGLVIECAGDGGPSSTLLSVRREINRTLVPQLRDGPEAVRRRVLSVLLGDIDPAPIPTLVESGLHDPSSYVRAMSAASFIVYASSSPRTARTAVPQLLELLADPDLSVRPVAAGALRAIAGRDLGENQAAWREWWGGQQR